MVETQQQMSFCDSQIECLRINKRKCDLTKAQVNQQPEDTRLFWNVGRA